jgi:hypothetical protein
MAKIRYQRFSVTGSGNAEVLDTGIESSEAEPKSLIGVYLYVTGWIDNIIIGYHETTKVLELPDYLVHTNEQYANSNCAKSVDVLTYIELPIDLPLGQRFKIGIKCGGTAKNLIGAYKYEIKG